MLCSPAIKHKSGTSLFTNLFVSMNDYGPLPKESVGPVVEGPNQHGNQWRVVCPNLVTGMAWAVLAQCNDGARSSILINPDTLRAAPKHSLAFLSVRLFEEDSMDTYPVKHLIQFRAVRTKQRT